MKETQYTDHVENRLDIYRQLVVATREIRFLIRLAGVEGIHFAKIAYQDAVNLESDSPPKTA
jgi:hypothetical protein